MIKQVFRKKVKAGWLAVGNKMNLMTMVSKSFA
jgi:hypothetical protein